MAQIYQFADYYRPQPRETVFAAVRKEGKFRDPNLTTRVLTKSSDDGHAWFYDDTGTSCYVRFPDDYPVIALG